jgi:hypothetical protein
MFDLKFSFVSILEGTLFTTTTTNHHLHLSSSWFSVHIHQGLAAEQDKSDSNTPEAGDSNDDDDGSPPSSYLLTAATCKHLAAYSFEGNSSKATVNRHNFDAVVSQQVMGGGNRWSDSEMKQKQVGGGD